MSRHTLAVFLALAIAQLFVIHQVEGDVQDVKGVCAQDATPGADDSCAPDAAKALTCEGTTCKVKIGGLCTASSSDECVATAAMCPATGDLKCACPDNKVANAEGTECSPVQAPVAVQGAALGAACSDTVPCDAAASKMLTCDNSLCKVKIGGDCTAGSDTECVASAVTCPALATGDAAGTKKKCACADNHVSNSKKTECLAYVGQPCSATCVPNTEACSATVKTCTCKAGFTAKADKSACDGATGVMASLVLLVSAFLTSRVM